MLKFNFPHYTTNTFQSLGHLTHRVVEPFVHQSHRILFHNLAEFLPLVHIVVHFQESIFDIAVTSEENATESVERVNLLVFYVLCDPFHFVFIGCVGSDLFDGRSAGGCGG